MACMRRGSAGGSNMIIGRLSVPRTTQPVWGTKRIMNTKLKYKSYPRGSSMDCISCGCNLRDRHDDVCRACYEAREVIKVSDPATYYSTLPDL